MKRTLVIKFLMIFLCSFLLFNSSVVEAKPDFCENTDIFKLLQATLDRMNNNLAAQQGTAFSGGVIFDALYASRWLVTCSAMYGLENMEAAVELMKSPETFKTLNSASQIALERSIGHSGIETEGGAADGAMNELQLKAWGEMVQAFEAAITMPGFGEPIFNRSAAIAIVLIFIGLVARLTWSAYENLTGRMSDTGSPWGSLIIIVRCVAVILMVLFLKNITMFGIEMSNAVRDSIMDKPWEIINGTGYGYGIPPVEEEDGFSKPIVDPKLGYWTKGQIVNTPILDGGSRISSAFGVERVRSNGKGTYRHAGVDIGGPAGRQLKSPVDGYITYRIDGQGVKGGYGYYVEIFSSSDGSVHRLGHVQAFDKSKMHKRIKVTKGEVVASLGDTGRSFGAHVHWDIRKNGTLVSPQLWMESVEPGSGTVAGMSAPVPMAVRGFDTTISAGTVFNTLMGMRSKMAYLNSEKSIGDTFKSGWVNFWANVAGDLMYYLASAAVYVLMLLGDVLMAITLVMGPFVFALSLLPSFEGYVANWIKSYITFLFYQPLAAILTLLMFAILAVTIDTGFLIFALICILFVYAVTRIPNLADTASGATLSGIATTLAMLPAMAKMKAVGMGMKAAGSLVSLSGVGAGLGAAMQGAGTIVNTAADKVSDAAKEASSGSAGKGGNQNGGQSGKRKG